MIIKGRDGQPPSYHTTVQASPHMTHPIHSSHRVIFSKNRKSGFWFPGHIGIGVTGTIFKHFHDAVTGHIEVFPGIAAVRQVVACESIDENRVNAFCLENVQQFAQVGGLFMFVADKFAFQADRPASLIPFHNGIAAPAEICRTAKGRASELGDRHRLPLGDGAADEISKSAGDLARSIAGIG